MDSKEVAQVDVQSAWLSKINWGEVVKVLCAFAAVKGINIPTDIQNDILMTIISAGAVYTFVMKTWFTKTITPASAAGPDVPTKTIPTDAIVKILLVAFALSLFLAPRAQAADVSGAAAINKALTAGYPTKCGFYYGIGTGGNAGAVNGAAVGTQIVQGDLDAIVGYTCPFATNAFWFAEGSFGFANLNGSSNGIALSGPLVFIERFGAGSPINSIMANPFANLNASMPSIPLLPTGVTTSPGNGYFFAGMVQQDIGAQIGALSGHQWVIAPLIGLGVLTRASNNVMIDTWAGWQMNSNSFCPGGGTSCARLGNMARVGVSLKY